MIFFWGYRTHALITKEGICLVEKTLPNNLTDAQVAFSLIKELKQRYRFKKGAIFIADKAYDVREIYTFIVDKMKSQPYIPINPRNRKEDKTFGPHGGPICDAGIEMKSAGQSRGRRRGYPAQAADKNAMLPNVCLSAQTQRHWMTNPGCAER